MKQKEVQRMKRKLKRMLFIAAMAAIMGVFIVMMALKSLMGEVACLLITFVLYVATSINRRNKGG